jgi:hypothetical protein
VVVNKVKEKSEGAIRRLISELEMWFPKQDIVIALGVVYPQYWVVDPTATEQTFFLTLTRWKWLFVTFIKLVDWTKMFLCCFELTCLTCSLVISKWACYIILRHHYVKKIS